MAGPYFPVERVVATRKMKVRVAYTLKLIRNYMAKRHVEFLVLWEGYTKEEYSHGFLKQALQLSLSGR